MPAGQQLMREFLVASASLVDHLVSIEHARARNRCIYTAEELGRALQRWARGGPAPPPGLVRRCGSKDVVDLRGMRCSRRLDLREFYFEVAVDLREARIDGPLLAGDAVFEFGLQMAGVRIRGALEAPRARFERPNLQIGEMAGRSERAIDGVLLDLDHVAIHGDLTLSRVFASGAINLNGARVYGDVLAHGLEAREGIDLRDAVVAGGVFANARSHVRGIPAWLPASAGTLVLDGARLRGALVLEGFSGEITADGLEADAIALKHVQARTISLQRVRVRGAVSCVAATVAADIDLRNSDCDELLLAGCTIGDALTLTATSVRRFAWITSFASTPTRIGRDLEAYGLSVGRDLKLAGVQAGGTFDIRGAHLGALDVSPTLLQQRFEQFELACARARRLDARGLNVQGGVSCLASIAADADFSNGTIRGDLTVVPGSAASAGASWPRWFDWVVRNAAPLELVDTPGSAALPQPALTRTRVGRLVLRDIDCSGSVDLSDLELGDGQDPAMASLDAAGAVIKGSLALCGDAAPGGPAGPRLRLRAGAIGLGGAVLGHLRLSGESYASRPGASTADPLSWAWARVGVSVAGAIGAAAWLCAVIALARSGLVAWVLQGAQEGASGAPLVAWKPLGAALLLGALGWTSLGQARRVLALSASATGEAGGGSSSGLSPAQAAAHHLMALHGVGSRELSLAIAQCTYRVVLAAALIVLVVWPFVLPGGAGEALRLPLLALASLLLRGYLRVLVAACHARSCSGAWSSGTAPAGVSGRPGAAVSLARGLKNVAALVVGLDAWVLLALCGVVLIMDEPPWKETIRHPFGLAAALLVLPILVLKGSRQLQLGLRRRESRRTGAAPVPAERVESAPAAHSPEAADASIATGRIADPAVRRAIAALSLRVMAFRDLMQVASLNVIAPRVLPTPPPALDLDSARIGDLEILKPIPRSISLGRLSVERWRIDAQDEPLDTLEVLDHAAAYKADIYQKVADTLSNGGQRTDAEAVFRAGRRQRRWRDRSWTQTTLSLVHGLIGYGTHRGPLLAVMGLWFVFSATWFAADYERVLGAGAALAIDALQVADCRAGSTLYSAAECQAIVKAARAPLEVPDPVSRIARGVAVAIRYHVPIIPWDMWPYAQPKDNLVWGYTALVTAVHWILWPLLLASLIPALLPRSDRG